LHAVCPRDGSRHRMGNSPGSLHSRDGQDARMGRQPTVEPDAGRVHQRSQRDSSHRERIAGRRHRGCCIRGWRGSHDSGYSRIRNRAHASHRDHDRQAPDQDVDTRSHGETLRSSTMATILVADDDTTCRASIQKVLEREGHTVHTAENVDGALEALRLYHFDLVVCDYRMPGKTGIDLLIELSRQQSAVPVLMISAYADALVEAAILKLGALEVLKKPIRRKELIDRTAKDVGG